MVISRAIIKDFVTGPDRIIIPRLESAQRWKSGLRAKKQKWLQIGRIRQSWSAVNEIELSKRLAEKENEQRLEQIANEMHLAKLKAAADAEFYAATREAEANAQRITPELIQLEAVRALSNNTKVYFGESLPKMFVDPSLLPAGRSGT